MQHLQQTLGCGLLATGKGTAKLNSLFSRVKRRSKDAFTDGEAKYLSSSSTSVPARGKLKVAWGRPLLPQTWCWLAVIFAGLAASVVMLSCWDVYGGGGWFFMMVDVVCCCYLGLIYMICFPKLCSVDWEEGFETLELALSV